MAEKRLQTNYLVWIFLSLAILFFLTTLILAATSIFQNKKNSDLELQNQALIENVQSSLITTEKLSRAVNIIEKYAELYISARESAVDVIFDFIIVKDELAQLDSSNPDFTAIDNAYFKLKQDMDNNKQITTNFIKYIDENKEILNTHINSDLESLKKEYNDLLTETSNTHKNLKQQINTEKQVYGFPLIP